MQKIKSFGIEVKSQGTSVYGNIDAENIQDAIDKIKTIVDNGEWFCGSPDEDIDHCLMLPLCSPGFLKSAAIVIRNYE